MASAVITVSYFSLFMLVGHILVATLDQSERILKPLEPESEKSRAALSGSLKRLSWNVSLC